MSRCIDNFARNAWLTYSDREGWYRSNAAHGGTLDDKSQFKPVTSLFCEQAPTWVEMPKDTENLPRYYT